MSDREINEIVAKAAEAAVATWVEKTGHVCRYDLPPPDHKKQHEALSGIIETLDRLNGIKWGVLRGFLQAILIAGFLALLAFLWTHGVKE